MEEKPKRKRKKVTSVIAFLNSPSIYSKQKLRKRFEEITKPKPNDFDI